METREPKNHASLEKPEFDGKDFTVLYFAPVGGFEVKTRKSLRRRDNLTIPFPASSINKANADEMSFQKRENEKALERGEKRDVHPLRTPNFRTKVGVLNLKRNRNVLVFDTKPSTFVMYNDDKNIGLATPEQHKLRSEFGSILAVAIILTTTEQDGNSKMIIQHRSVENRSYKDVIGASAAGIVDQQINTLDSEKPATLKPVDTDFIKSVAIKEMVEEDGITPEYVDAVNVTGIAEDNKRKHYEMLLIGKVKTSAKKVEEMAKRNKKNELGAFDFSEDFFVIDATPEAIRILLTKIKCPLPSTHAAAFVAAGRLMVLEKEGVEKAEEWTRQMEKDIQINNQEIDDIVNKATDGKEKTYNPRLTPQEQGLPSVEDELKRVKLIDDMEPISSTEALKTVEHCFLFDVDGVITNPAEKRVTEEGLIETIAEKLDNGDIVTLNTGRSLSWMMDRVIKPIENAVKDKKNLNNFLAVGEKGGSWLFFQDGEWITEIDENLSTPENLQNTIRNLINDKFRDCMFYDESKLTMISTEMIDGHPIAKYSEKQHVLVEEMKQILEQSEFKSLDLKIDPTTIATDIQNSHVGKHLGARRIANWLKEKNIKPEHVIAIGDSQSDTEMAEELQDEYSLDFVFVGNPEKLKFDKLKKKPIFTKSRFGEGTLEFLQNTTS